MTDGGRADGSGDGFTLLEVVVAFAIMAMALSALMLAFSGGLRTADRAEAAGYAVMQAQSLLDRVAAELPAADGTAAGTFDNGSTWTVDTRRSADSQSGPGAGRGALGLYEVAVTVSWDAGRSVTLTTMRAVPDDG